MRQDVVSKATDRSSPYLINSYHLCDLEARNVTVAKGPKQKTINASRLIEIRVHNTCLWLAAICKFANFVTCRAILTFGNMCQLDKSTRIFIKTSGGLSSLFDRPWYWTHTQAVLAPKKKKKIFFCVRCAALGFSVDAISGYRPAVGYLAKNRKHVNQFQGWALFTIRNKRVTSTQRAV